MNMVMLRVGRFMCRQFSELLDFTCPLPKVRVLSYVKDGLRRKVTSSYCEG
jgi:hypothetical protein